MVVAIIEAAGSKTVLSENHLTPYVDLSELAWLSGTEQEKTTPLSPLLGARKVLSTLALTMVWGHDHHVSTNDRPPINPVHWMM